MQGKQPVQLGRRDAFEAAAIPGIVRYPEQRPQQERIEELLAELLVAHPELVFPIAPKGQAIDEDRLGPQELDVVGARVRQRDALLQAAHLDVEVQERGTLERREAPLVRIGDERQLRVLHDIARIVEAAWQAARLDPLLGDRRAFGDQRLEHPGRTDELEIGRGTRHDSAQHAVAKNEDPTAGITIGAGVCRRLIHSGASAFDEALACVARAASLGLPENSDVTNSRNRCQ